MPETSQKKATPTTCQIVGVVVGSKARVIVRQFKDGSSTRTLSRVYGLSRAGVEELIRAYGWLRSGRKPAAVR